jgi:hypothetical protein
MTLKEYREKVLEDVNYIFEHIEDLDPDDGDDLLDRVSENLSMAILTGMALRQLNGHGEEQPADSWLKPRKSQRED